MSTRDAGSGCTSVDTECLGKTAPRLIQDLFLYDPQIPPAWGSHVLTEPPPQYFPPKKSQKPYYGQGCRHEYVTKKMQSGLPPMDHRPTFGTTYSVGAVCCKCRTHVSIELDFSDKKGNNPCPNKQYPLHHFIYQWSKSHSAVDTSKPQSQWKETQTFKCSSPSCGAELTINFKDPVLSHQEVELLTSEKLLQQRITEAKKIFPEIFKDTKKYSPLDVLNDLQLYITNCLEGHESRALGKRYITSFGVEARAFKGLLESLGFVFQPSGKEDVSEMCRT